MTRYQNLRLDRQLCFALYAATHGITRSYRVRLKEVGLTYPQYLVMLVLWEQDGLGVSELGERLFLDSGTVTPLLKRMEVAGLLRRVRATDDERKVRIELTPEGRKLRARGLRVPACVAEATRCALPELLALNTQLRELRTSLGTPTS